MNDMNSVDSQFIKVAENGIEKLSTVNGPGLRYTIFTQGCEHNCYACHNPGTHDYDNSGDIYNIHDIYNDILKYSKYIKGITFTGGDPLYIKNYFGVLNLCKLIKNNANMNIWLYTGYSWDYVKELGIVKYIDVLIDGKFIYTFKSFDLKFKGSSNQRIIDVPKSLKSGNIIEWKE